MVPPVKRCPIFILQTIFDKWERQFIHLHRQIHQNPILNQNLGYKQFHHRHLGYRLAEHVSRSYALHFDHRISYATCIPRART